jgi:hypothetical protein
MDGHDLLAIEKRMEDARLYLRNNAANYGDAKQVREFSSDRRKQTLARHMRPFVNNGDSNALADTKARSGDAYAIELDKLADAYAAAETTIALYDAAEVSFDAARSLLSMAKSQMQLA